MMGRVRWLLLFALASIWSAGGCSSSDRPIPVRGRVTLDGNPVENATVTFVSMTDNRRPAYGHTDSQGRFTLSTTQSGDGAVAGEYKVVIAPAAKLGPQSGPLRRPDQADEPGPDIHENYRHAKDTPLIQVVPAPGGEVHLILNKEGK